MDFTSLGKIRYTNYKRQLKLEFVHSKKLGFPVFAGNNPTIRTIGIDGTNGLWIGDPCNGLSLFALFISLFAHTQENGNINYGLFQSELS